MRILIAEDESISRRLLVRTLEHWGHEVLSACNGEEAWRQFQETDARMVISDWMMPDLDGPGLCQRIRDAEAEVRGSSPAYVIMLTSRDTTDDLTAGFAAGANDFIAKPFHQDELRARLNAGMRILALQAELVQMRNEMERLAMTDALTGLMNRRAMYDAMHKDDDRMRREHRAMGLVMGDVDHFKAINDTWGHQVGDRVLKVLAECLQASIRGGDYVGRWGGEEFLIALPGADIIQCAEVAERCRTLLASQEIGNPKGGKPLTVSMSFGASSTGGADREDLPTLVQQADKALYWAKQSGRDRVKIYVRSMDPDAQRRIN